MARRGQGQQTRGLGTAASCDVSAIPQAESGREDEQRMRCMELEREVAEPAAEPRPPAWPRRRGSEG